MSMGVSETRAREMRHLALALLGTDRPAHVLAVYQLAELRDRVNVEVARGGDGKDALASALAKVEAAVSFGPFEGDLAEADALRRKAVTRVANERWRVLPASVKKTRTKASVAPGLT